MKKLTKIVFAASLFFSIEANADEKLSVYSPDFKDQAMLTKKNEFNSFGCNGKNKAPLIKWKNAPKDTKSFALTVYDPDAPTGSGWWHFVSYNIPANATSVDLNNPLAIIDIANNDAGAPNYMGPCPPVRHGKHHYIFTITALNAEKLDLPANASAAYVGYMINQHKIESATITGIYERK